MASQTPSGPSQSVQVFEPEDGAESDADIYVVDTFDGDYDRERARLDGATYPAKEIIKFDWNVTHHDFDGDAKHWIVDVDALDELEERLNDAGYSTDFSPEQDANEGLFDALDAATEGDRITVRYQKKNKEGTSEFSGTITYVDDPEYPSEHAIDSDPWETKPLINFRRDDEQAMFVQYDQYGKVGLFTQGSHAPFVGAVAAIEIESRHPRRR